MKTTKLNRVALSVALMLFIVGGLSFLSYSVAQRAPRTTLDLNWQSKVDPSVLSQAALAPAEFYIHMTDQADLSGADALDMKEQKGEYVFQQLTAKAAATQSGVKQVLALAGAEYKAFWVSNGIWAKGNLAVVQAVAVRPEVAYIYASGGARLSLPPQEEPLASSPDSPNSPNIINAPPDTTIEPGLNIVDAEQVWARGILGDGVVVAGADTGVRWTHNALKPNYRGWNGSTADHNYNWHDGIHVQDPLNPCPAVPPAIPQNSTPEPCDDDAILGGGHGSHTVGTMVGDDGDQNRIGMAPGAQWIACRNMNQGVGAVPTYMECMEWFIAPTNIAGTNPMPSKAPHVINNSWGCVEGCPPPALRNTLQASRAAGIFYAVSAGNDGDVSCGSIYHPLARYPEAFTVGSTTHTTDTVSDFSSRGPTTGEPDAPVQIKPNIAAPGSTIRSAQRASDSAYANLSGTSMAGPHVAGLVALLISANPRLAGKIDRLENIIELTAVRKYATSPFCPPDTATSVPNNVYGWGRIDALAAVIEALPPVAVDDTATTAQNTPVTINVLANDTDEDNDPLAVTAVSNPPNGSAVINGDQTITYTPDTSFSGQDTFTYTMCAPEGCDTTSDTATVTVTVTGAGLTNYALSSSGGVATASSSHSSGLYLAAATINGDRIGNTWGTVNGGWNDGTRAAYPDDLEVAFGAAKTISEIRVFTLQNGWALAGEPTETSSCSAEGILDFDVQYWNGQQWVTIPSGNVTGNDRAMRVFTFPAISTTKIRVHVTNARNNWTRIVEVEAFGAAGQ
ncbi:MAG TPA: S8 family serine peptidase [Pyrinomonadaceae bacterium]|nr:S8 family serine peptidase [Pyrinomonadaceae bacterium]